MNELRISFWCGLLTLILLVMFANTANQYVLLAAALCLGGLAGYEVATDMPMLSGALLSVAVIFWSQAFGLQGAALTNAFFPSAQAGTKLGLANFLMLVAIGGYFIWNLVRTMDWLDDRRNSAARI